MKYSDGREIDGDVSCSVHISPAYIVRNDYRFDYEVTENETVVINKISSYEGKGNGEITIPASIDGLPVSGFAEEILDDINYVTKIHNKTNVELILPKYEYDQHIWLNEDKTERIQALSNGVAVRQHKYNKSLAFKTVKVGNDAPLMAIEEFDSPSNQNHSSILGYYDQSISFVANLHNWFYYEEDPTGHSGNVAGISIYIERKYDSILREMKVRRYTDYPLDSSFPNTETWDELTPDPAEGGIVTKAYSYRDDKGNLTNELIEKETVSENAEGWIRITTLLPQEATDKTILWESSNDNIVKLITDDAAYEEAGDDTKGNYLGRTVTRASSEGLRYKAVGAGTVKITGTTNDGGKKKVTVTITVKKGTVQR